MEEIGGESDVVSSSGGASWYKGAPHITATAASSRSIPLSSFTRVPEEGGKGKGVVKFP